MTSQTKDPWAEHVRGQSFLAFCPLRVYCIDRCVGDSYLKLQSCFTFKTCFTLFNTSLYVCFIFPPLSPSSIYSPADTPALSRGWDIRNLQPLRLFDNKISLEQSLFFSFLFLKEMLFPPPPKKVRSLLWGGFGFRKRLFYRNATRSKNAEPQRRPGANSASHPPESKVAVARHRKSNGFTFLHRAVAEAPLVCSRCRQS